MEPNQQPGAPQVPNNGEQENQMNITPPPVPNADPVMTTPPVPPMTPFNTPAPAPFGPNAPLTTPIASAPMAPTTKNTKKILIIVGSIVAALLILAVVGVVLVSLFTVSKKDYSAALDQYNKVADANSTAGTKLSALGYEVDSATDTVYNNDLSAAKNALTDIKAQNDALGKLKAMRIGGAAAKYTAFNTKLGDYLTYTNNLVTSLDAIRPAMVSCGSTSSSTALSALKGSVDACVASLNKLATIPDSDVKTYIGKLTDQYKQLSSVLDQLMAISDPYGTQYSQYTALRDQVYSVSDTISSASTDFSSNLDTHSKAVDPKSAADDLASYLQSHAF